VPSRPTKQRRYLIVPGVRSSNLHIVDCGVDQKAPRLHKVISGAEIKARTNLSAPHTVHCLGSDIIISMLGDARGNAPGGFLHLNENFEIVGRWENDLGGMKFNYDFWYQPRHNVMVSSEWAAPNTFMPGFDLEEVGQLKYGREIHFWDFKDKRVEKTMYLGEDGLVPLEVRFHHDPIRATASSAPPSRRTSSIGASATASGSGKRSSTSRTCATRNGRSRCRASSASS
jgi:selenium-binding protein 1